MEQKRTELTVKGMALDRKSQLPILLLYSKQLDCTLPLWIGPFEASAIITEMEGVHPPRPLTHDLFSQFFSKHGFLLESIELFDKLEEKYLCKMYYKKGIKSYSMEIRPSDGIALALRLEAPIFAAEELLDKNTANTFIQNNQDLLNTDVLLLRNDQLKSFFM